MSLKPLAMELTMRTNFFCSNLKGLSHKIEKSRQSYKWIKTNKKMNLWWFFKLSVASRIFIFNLQVLQRYCKRGALSLQTGHTSYKEKSLEVIQYLLPTALKGNKYPLSKYQSVLATLWQIHTICKNCQCPWRNLSEGCQYPVIPYKNLPEGCQQPLIHLQQDCPSNI
jgi:hypothetical protein